MPRHFIGLSPLCQRPAWGAVSSLPAGINKDDSDPPVVCVTFWIGRCSKKNPSIWPLFSRHA